MVRAQDLRERAELFVTEGAVQQDKAEHVERENVAEEPVWDEECKLEEGESEHNLSAAASSSKYPALKVSVPVALGFHTGMKIKLQYRNSYPF